MTKNLPPCGNACDFCLCRVDLPAIIKANLKAALIDLLIGPNILHNPTLGDAFVAALQSYPNVQSQIFGSKAQACPQVKTIKSVVLMLIATGIITHNICHNPSNDDKGVNVTILARLALDANLYPVLYDDAVWAKLPLKD